MLSRLKHDEQGCIGLQIGNIVGSRRVLQRLPQILGDLVAGAECPAIRKLLVRRRHAAKEIRGWAGFDFEKIEAGSYVAIEKIRFREAQIDLLRAERNHGANSQILTAPEKISLPDVDVCQRPIGRREADA